MRTRIVLPAALAASALILIPALPAAAATTTWTQPGDSWWSAASWTTTAPVAGDDVVFAGGVRSTYNLGDVAFSSFRFTNEHLIANGGGLITLTNGIAVDAGAAAAIQPGLTTSGSQTWTVGAGGTLTLPSHVGVDPAATLTLDVDGTFSVTTGNLDGGAAACITTSGAGVVSFASGGGAAGACPGYPSGIVAAGAETTFAPGAFLGGTDFVAAGGLFTGGSTASPATVRRLALVGGGTVSPGTSAGTDLGRLELWGTSAWGGGTYLVDVIGGGLSDRVSGAGQAVSVAGTSLSPRLSGTPVPGETWSVLESDIAVSGQFVSPAGAALDTGDEFEANGQIFSVRYLPQSVEVTWERAAPVVVPPVIPAAPSLPPTGSADALPGALFALAALLGGAGMVVARGPSWLGWPGVPAPRSHRRSAV